MSDDRTQDRIKRVERGRGILSKRDRKYLRDESNVEPGSAHERMIRKDIRDRLENAIRDFRLLVNHLPAKDRKKAIEKLGEPDNEYYDWFSNVIAFLYLAGTDDPRFEVEQMIERGIQIGANKADQSIEKLVIDLETYPAEIGELREKLETGEDITLLELERLLQSNSFPDLRDSEGRYSYQMEIDYPVEDYTDIRLRFEGSSRDE